MDLSFPRLLLIPRTEWTAKEMLGDVYGVWLVYTLFSLTERERKRRKEVERSWCQRKLFVFKQLYERYLVVEIFFCLLFISGNIYIKRD